jgi:predicted phage-related endonuclease
MVAAGPPMTETRPITNRAEWLAWRQADVTASDVAAVLGLHPDRTIAKVWANKVGLIGEDPPSEFCEYRLSLEAAALDWLGLKRPDWRISRPNNYLRDPDLRLGATPDALASNEHGLGLIEVKSVVRYVFERDWKQFGVGDDGVIDAEAPIYHQLQALAGAMLARTSWLAVVALILDNAGTGSLAIAPVQRNAEAEDRIRDGVARFWAMTDAGKQPPFDYGLDAEVIAALFPKARIAEPPLDLSADNRLPELLTERQALKAELRTREHRCEGIDAEIKAKLGDHELATLPGWRISWKTQKRPERITPAWEGRVLRVTATKEVT